MINGKDGYPGLLAIKDKGEFRNKLDNIREFQIRFDGIIIKYPDDSDRDVRCYNWTVNQRYYHTEQPQVRVELDFQPDPCSGPDVVYLYSKYTWLNVIVIILAIASFTLEIMQLLETVNTMRKLRNFFYMNDQTNDKKK